MSLMDAELHWSAMGVAGARSRRVGDRVLAAECALIAIKRWRNALILPLSVAVVVLDTTWQLASLGISGTEARASGLLLTSTADGNLGGLGPRRTSCASDWTAFGEVPTCWRVSRSAFICVS